METFSSMATSSQNINFTTQPPVLKECSFSPSFKIILSILLPITSIASFTENVFFCYVVYANSKLHVKSNILIVSLAVTDIVISVTAPIFEFIYVHWNPDWPIGSVGTNVQNSFWMFSLVAPFATVTAITIDRYLAITKSIRYKTIVTTKRLFYVVIFLWVYSIMWVIVMASNFLDAPEDRYLWNVRPTLYYIFLALHIVIPLIIIPVLYRQIILTVRQSRHQAGVTTPKRSDVKLAKTIGFVIGFLFLVWFPVAALEVVYNFDFSECIVEQAGTVSVWITCINGAINPIVYSYRNVEVNKYVRRLIYCGRKPLNVVSSQTPMLNQL